MLKITEAILKVQAEMQPVKKDSENPFFKSKYSDLETIWDSIQPILEKNKLIVMNQIETIGDKTFLKTILLHESGENIESSIPLVTAKNDMQSLGSAISYARRYNLTSLLSIVTTDDDGNEATGKNDAQEILHRMKSVLKKAVDSKDEKLYKAIKEKWHKEKDAIHPEIWTLGETSIIQAETHFN